MRTTIATLISPSLRGRARAGAYFLRAVLALAALSVALPVAIIGCGGSEQSPPPAEDRDRTLTVYSGRSESLVHPLLEAFGESTGIDIRVKYGGSASTAATLLEEGDNTPGRRGVPARPRFPGQPGSGGYAGESAPRDAGQG